MAQQDGTVKNILFIQSGAALLKLCFSSYGKETVINTCISPWALGGVSEDGTALTEGKEGEGHLWWAGFRVWRG